MVSHRTPRVYATVTAHVNRHFRMKVVKGPAAAERGSALTMLNNDPGDCCRIPQADRKASSYQMMAGRHGEDEEAGKKREGSDRRTMRPGQVHDSGNQIDKRIIFGCCWSFLCQFRFFLSGIFSLLEFV